MSDKRPHIRGRGSQLNPINRFDIVHVEDDFEQVEGDEEYFEHLSNLKTEYLPDNSKSIISENDSPDTPFRYSLNPYRGCSHGCAYCYARPTHEYLGLNAGVDFESKIFVKEHAAELFREFLSRPKYQPELIGMSGVTDCYQPAERKYRLTRSCLEVALEFRQPVGVITKNALVVRDLDLLTTMATQRLIQVNISMTSLDHELTQTLEPRTSAPAAKLRAIRTLTAAGIPVRVLVSPIIPGLNDSSIPAVLEAAREAGAQAAGYILLRLPLTVLPVFQEWLERTHPTQRERIEHLIQNTRDGGMNSSQFGERMRGTGAIAEQIQQTFRLFRRKLGYADQLPPLDYSHFEPPRPKSGQLTLF
ncbi:MAG: Radical superfamily protein [Planctomycetaceae bacterium]|nr:Radical superfamily protein [Planctomycetaceae bacterium]